MHLTPIIPNFNQPKLYLQATMHLHINTQNLDLIECEVDLNAKRTMLYTKKYAWFGEFCSFY